MQRHHVLLPGADPVEDGRQVVERVVVTNHNQDIALPDAQGLRRELLSRLQMELVQPRVGRTPASSNLLGGGKYPEKDQRSNPPGARGYQFLRRSGLWAAGGMAITCPKGRRTRIKKA